MSTVVEAKNLRRVFRTATTTRTAVDDVDMRISSEEIVALFGPSGSGKSTLLGILGGLDRSFEGDLRLLGHDVTSMSDRALSRFRGERLGFVFQAFHLLDHLTVLDNVMVPSIFTPRAQGCAKARAALEQVGLADRENDPASSLSGGQRQRVAVARAIVHKPAFLLCDEPTGNLDDTTARQIIDIFVSLNHDEGTTVLCATHDERIAKVSTRTMNILHGKVDRDGEVDGQHGGRDARP